MKTVISEISNSFINEAIASPRMFEDLAAMEKYMSESYDGRTFVELLQNADDAQANKIKVFIVDDTLIVANDGRPFNKEDIMSICRSGASNKQRGNNIGYRGVGFKSSTTISTEIIIHSGSTFFTFSKSACAKLLKKDLNKVPTVRIPFLFDDKELGENINKDIEICKNEGFTTFFIFLNANIEKFIDELEGFDASWLLFLKSIWEVNIECSLLKKRCKINRNTLSSNTSLLSIDGSKTKWYIVNDNNVSLAFKYDESIGIIPCDTEEGVFHCFLPTLDKTGFPFKINADFSTDPSRKHIIQDDSTNKAINYAQILYVDVIQNVIRKKQEKYYSILSLVTIHTTLNTLVSQFENGLLEKLRVSKWVPLSNNQYVTPTNAKTYPKWLDLSEIKLIFQDIFPLTSKVVQSSFVEKTEKIEVLLNKLGSLEITISELSLILTNANYISLLSIKLWAKLFVYCYRAMISDQSTISSFFVPLESGYIQLLSTTDETKLNNSFLIEIKNILSTKEIETLSISYGVFSVLQSRKKNTSILNKQESITKKTQLNINKWKTPVQNCITLETQVGNVAKDVSRQSNEYNIISTNPEAITYYIAVKTVGLLGDSFKMTESEYEAAKRYGDQYKVYLFTTDTSNIKYSIINNPIATTYMKKVVKEYEWVCNTHVIDNVQFEDKVDMQFDSVQSNQLFEMDFDNMNGQEFERFCALLLIKNGYEDVSITKTSGDQGLDIIAYRDGIKFGIQCKRYSSDIGNDAVQEVFAGKTFYKCNIGVVLTNQHFTHSAIQLAENNGVVLWGREMLLKLIKNSKE